MIHSGLLLLLAFVRARYTIFAGTGGCDDSDFNCDNSPIPAVAAYDYSSDKGLTPSFTFQPDGLPSWLYVHGECLFVTITDSEYIESYLISTQGNAAKPVSRLNTGGVNPVYIDVMGNTLVIANYHGPDTTANSTGAGVTSMYFNTDCVLTAGDFKATSGRSVDPGRQGSSHMHSTIVDPYSTTNEIVACDLGADLLRTYSIGSSIQPLTTFETTPGSGPRHLVFHPTQQGVVYLLHEMGQYIAVLTKDLKGTFKEVQRVSTLREGAVFPGYTKAAEILITADAKFVLASNRGFGSNGGTVAVFRTEADHSLKLAGIFPVGDPFPRGMELLSDERTLIVAGQSQSMLRVFHLNDKDGTLNQVGHPVQGPPHPTTITYYSN